MSLPLGIINLPSVHHRMAARQPHRKEPAIFPKTHVFTERTLAVIHYDKPTYTSGTLDSRIHRAIAKMEEKHD